MKTKLLLFNILVFFCSLGTNAQTHAHEINNALGRGVNLGSAFEAPRGFDAGVHINATYFTEISNMGFSHVRVPVKWSAYASIVAPYNIEQWFFDTIGKVIDAALENGLYVMINMHHYDDFNDNPDSWHRTRFLELWKQIAEEFKDYSDSLLFEFLNEPHQNMDAENWNSVYKQVLDTVRKTNPYRICVIGPTSWNSPEQVDLLDWPADTGVILSLHHYAPFEFTHQGAGWVGDQSLSWLGTTWDSTANEIQAIKDAFQKVRDYALLHNAPVHVGEFGAYEKADMDSRKKWTACCARVFESFGFSWAYWDFCAGFAVYNDGLGTWKNELLYALTEHRDPNVVMLEEWEIQNTGFENGLGEWQLSDYEGAVSEFLWSNETGVIEVLNKGQSYWHIQLEQRGFAIREGAQYKLSFDARSEPQGIQIEGSVSRNGSPWDSYSGTKTASLTSEPQTFNHIFTMEKETDMNCRLVFNVGSALGRIYMDNISIEQLSLPQYVEEIRLTAERDVIDEFQGSVQLQAMVLPENAYKKDVEWELILGGSIASVSENGLLTANGSGNGNVKVLARAKDDNGVSAEYSIQISHQLDVHTIELNPTLTSIETYQGLVRIFYEVLPDNAAVKKLNWDITKGDSLARIEQSGFLYALGTGDGEVSVRASATDGSGVFSEVIISVINQVLADSIVLGAESDIISQYQGTLQLHASFYPPNVSGKNLFWQLKEGGNIASINQDGLLTALGLGNGKVRVRAVCQDGSNVFDDTELTLQNQVLGQETNQAPGFRAWIHERQLYFELPFTESDQCISLFTVEGKRVFFHSPQRYSSLSSVPLPEIPAGFYFVELKNGEFNEVVMVVYGF